VPERRGEESVCWHHDRAARASPDARRRSLEMPERFLHGALVRAPYRARDVLIAQGEQHTHALGCRERQVIRGDLHRPLAQPARPVRREAGEHRTQRVAVDAARSADLAGARAEPLSRRLRAVVVVVLDAARDARNHVHAFACLLEVVALLAAR
jgi:hypothetical protein